MKPTVLLALILCLFVFLWGCTAHPAKNSSLPTPSSVEGTTLATEQTSPTTEPVITVRQQPMTAVTLIAVTETETADDGTVIFYDTYQNISLLLPESEVADKIILDFLNRTDIHEDSSWIRQSAERMHTDGISLLPLWASITYKPVRVDQTVLSLYGSYATYTGGAHGSIACRSVTYDLTSGNPLTLGEILTESASEEIICQLVCHVLKPQAEAGGLFDDYKTTVTQLLKKPITSYTDWYLSGSGLCFCFSPYEIGPFSSGDIVAEIPYSELTGILKDEYFPPERDNVSGELQIISFEDADLEEFTQFAEIILDERGDKVLVYTDSALYDIRLETGTLSADGSRFIAEQTVFGASSLTPGDALMIKSAFDNTGNTLRLTYTAGDETVSRIINSEYHP